MKKHFLLLSILIITLISCTACNTSLTSKSRPNVPMGRYVESSWDLSSIMKDGDQLISCFMDLENHLNFYIRKADGLALYILNQDNTYTQKPLAWADEYNNYPYELDEVYQGASGELYIAGEYKLAHPFFAKIENNKIHIIPIEDTTPISHRMCWTVSDDNTLFVLDNDGYIMKYDTLSGTFLKKYSEYSFKEIKCYKNTLIGISSEAHAIITFDTHTDNILKKVPCSNDLSGIVTFFMDPTDESIYLFSSDGVWHLSSTGTVWEHLVEGSLCSLSSPSRFLITAFTYNHEFLIVYSSKDVNEKFKRLSYSSTTPTRPSTEVTVYALSSEYDFHDLIKETLNKYQLTHPDVYFKFITGASDTVSEDQAIQALNTELLTHRGPDIILLDGLPYTSYANNSLFADLSPCLKSLRASGDIIPGMSTAYLANDMIYAIPLRFSFATLSGDTSVIQANSLHDLALYKKAHPEETVYQYEDPEYLTKQLFPYCSATWNKKNGIADKDDIKTFLEDIKILSHDGTDYESRNLHDWLNEQMTLLDHDGQAHILTNHRTSNLLCTAYVNDQRGNFDSKLFPNESLKIFNGQELFSINANSPHKDIAMDILQSALSEDIQTRNLSDGFPTNPKALKKWLSYDGCRSDEVHSFFYFSYGATSQVTIKWSKYLNTLQYFYKNCLQLSTPTNQDKMQLQIIMDTSKDYYNDTLTLDEAVNDIYSKLQIHAAE